MLAPACPRVALMYNGSTCIFRKWCKVHGVSLSGVKIPTRLVPFSLSERRKFSNQVYGETFHMFGIFEVMTILNSAQEHAQSSSRQPLSCLRILTVLLDIPVSPSAR